MDLVKDVPVSTMIMLMERIDALEWAVQNILGSDVTIKQGIKISSVLLNTEDKNKQSFNHYLVQIHFPD